MYAWERTYWTDFPPFQVIFTNRTGEMGNSNRVGYISYMFRISAKITEPEHKFEGLFPDSAHYRQRKSID